MFRSRHYDWQCIADIASDSIKDDPLQTSLLFLPLVKRIRGSKRGLVHRPTCLDSHEANEICDLFSPLLYCSDRYINTRPTKINTTTNPAIFQGL